MLRLLLLSIALAAPPLAAQLARIELSAGFHRIEAELAADQATRMQGLMNRRSLPANHGMLFVFVQAAQHCMWMRNTYLPLSVAFLDEEGHIINIEKMQPESEVNHCASRAARYALEMNRDWFDSKGIQPGMRITGVDKSPRPR